MIEMKIRDIGYLMVAGSIEVFSLFITWIIKRRMKNNA
jgi:hypothetical protein